MLADLAALSRLVRAVYTTMTRLATEVALASGLTLDARVLALGLVVAHFAAIVTFAGILLVGTVTSKVAVLVAARDMSAGSKEYGDAHLHATSTVGGTGTKVAIGVLRDVLRGESAAEAGLGGSSRVVGLPCV